jgi:lysozyme
MDFITLLENHLRWAEGERTFPYRDTTGHLTIGVGRNLSEKGLSPDEIDHLLTNDVVEVLDVCRGLPYWNHLNDARRIVVADMVFNLGERGFHTFKKMEEALLHELYDEAAREMTDSTWFRQVGRRSHKLVKAMRTGLWGSSLH